MTHVKAMRLAVSQAMTHACETCVRRWLCFGGCVSCAAELAVMILALFWYIATQSRYTGGQSATLRHAERTGTRSIFRIDWNYESARIQVS